MRMNRLAAMAVLILVGLGASGARADGTIDFLIDPGNTYEIGAPGSYRLTGNVLMKSGVSAIIVLASDVVIDLGGHTIAGAGDSVSDGIVGPGFAEVRVTVRNGNITGFGGGAIAAQDDADWTVSDVNVSGVGRGINCGPRARIERCRVTGSNTEGGNAAIRVGDGSAVKDCVAAGNNPATGNTTGIRGTNGCRIEGCTVDGNVSTDSFAQGITLVDNGLVLNCIVRNNSGVATTTGIALNSNGTVKDCEAINNDSSATTAIGISTGARCIVSGCQALDQTSGAEFPAIGISTGASCTITGNSCANNDSSGSGDGTGISTTNGCTITGNTCAGNNEGPSGVGTSYGISTNTGSTVINNTCQVNSSNGAGNAIGIFASLDSKVEGNTCTGNVATGDGAGANEISTGIQVGTRCTVTGNSISNNGTSGTGAAGYGVDVTGNSNLIEGNNCAANGSAAFRFSVSTNNRTERNRLRQATDIDLVNGVAPASSGAGDLADIAY